MFGLSQWVAILVDWLYLLRRWLVKTYIDTVTMVVVPRLAVMHPGSRPERHHLSCLYNVAYCTSDIAVDAHSEDHHLLDVYLPRGFADARNVNKKHPSVFYIHGGSFRGGSKETHFIFALSWAKRGFVTFNVNYRTTPKHRFPCGLSDVCEAYKFCYSQENLNRYNIDKHRIVVSGDSAGANLSLSLGLILHHSSNSSNNSSSSEDEWGQRHPFVASTCSFEPKPACIWAACGILDMSVMERFSDPKWLRGTSGNRLLPKRSCSFVVTDYLQQAKVDLLVGSEVETQALHSPLLYLEKAAAQQAKQNGPRRALLCPVLLSCGTADPLLYDSRRLLAALTKLGIESELNEYYGELHGFHAMMWRQKAFQCWRDSFLWIDECLSIERDPDDKRRLEQYSFWKSFFRTIFTSDS